MELREVKVNGIPYRIKDDGILVETSIPEEGLLPNIVYNYGVTDEVNVTLLPPPSNERVDCYIFKFTCLSNECSLILPSSVKLPSDLDMEMLPYRTFECILDADKLLTFNCWD